VARYRAPPPHPGRTDVYVNPDGTIRIGAMIYPAILTYEQAFLEGDYQRAIRATEAVYTIIHQKVPRELKEEWIALKKRHSSIQKVKKGKLTLNILKTQAYEAGMLINKILDAISLYPESEFKSVTEVCEVMAVEDTSDASEED